MRTQSKQHAHGTTRDVCMRSLARRCPYKVISPRPLLWLVDMTGRSYRWLISISYLITYRRLLNDPSSCSVTLLELINCPYLDTNLKKHRILDKIRCYINDRHDRITQRLRTVEQFYRFQNKVYVYMNLICWFAAEKSRLFSIYNLLIKFLKKISA